MVPPRKRTLYVRRKDSEVWHFVLACSHYLNGPDATNLTTYKGYQPPATGSLCAECVHRNAGHVTLHRPDT